VLVPIGCVVLIAFTGIFAALLIPNFLDALQKAKSKRTVADMRVLGDAWASWATAQGLEVSGVTADWSVDFESLGAPATLEELEAQIGTDFAPIEGDGWKRPFEFRVVQSEGFATLAIRSAGRDGVWQSGSYEAGTFARAEYDQDIVWVNGDFVRWPDSGSPTNP
jgi:hypothetical protein